MKLCGGALRRGFQFINEFKKILPRLTHPTRGLILNYAVVRYGADFN
jgi:hypothetical protein